ncbi:MAG: carbohydrate kinase [Verrucomicrobiota bacterium]
MNPALTTRDRPLIVGVGEVLWDLLPAGAEMGGAPANFAYHAHALGAMAGVVTRVGNDALGAEIVRRCQQFGFVPDAVQLDDTAPTSTVSVSLCDAGVPCYVIHENVAWDQLAVTPAALALVRQADAVCFGTLAQRNGTARAAIQRLIAAASAPTWRVLDINLRQNFYSRVVIEQSLRLANVLKLNDSELPILAEMFHLGGAPRQQIEALAKGFGLRLVALTQGTQGSLLYQEGRWSQQPSLGVQVVDTVGAGDAFTAALVMGLLQESSLDDLHATAAELAAHVCAHAGATPPPPPQIRARFANLPNRPHQQSSEHDVFVSAR